MPNPPNPPGNRGSDREARVRLSSREMGGIVVVVAVVIFILMNRDLTNVSFLFFTAFTPLWVALTVAGAGGFVAGFLLGRKRYR